MLRRFNAYPRAKLTRQMRDMDTLRRARPHEPVPLISAPGLGGDIQHAIFYPGEKPVTVHMWSHFEVYPDIEHLVDRWTVDHETYPDMLPKER